MHLLAWERALDAFERRVLERLPGFAVLRSVARPVSGTSDDAQVQPVLVEIEEALTPAFIVEELDADRFLVLVPAVPTPAAGSLYIASHTLRATQQHHRRAPRSRRL